MLFLIISGRVQGVFGYSPPLPTIIWYNSSLCNFCYSNSLFSFQMLVFTCGLEEFECYSSDYIMGLLFIVTEEVVMLYYVIFQYLYLKSVMNYNYVKFMRILHLRTLHV